MSFRRDFARLRALSPAERRLLRRALALLPACALGVKLVGLRRTREWFGAMRPIPQATAQQVVRMAAAAARRAPWKDGCLPAALALERMLAAQGIGSELRLGVRKVGGRFEAHAWLERDGQRIIDTAESASFAALEPARERA
ncbi:MAG TPA: lasso peptide biosynthesis B2 protein [Usitatibacter sp.]|nr:lasso peptide biosynthesis B2 protein [Usitatibacter sp.]